MFIDLIVLEQQERLLEEEKEKIRKNLLEILQALENIHQKISIPNLNQSFQVFQEQVNALENHYIKSLDSLTNHLKQQTKEYHSIKEETRKKIMNLINQLDTISPFQESKKEEGADRN